MDERKVLSSPFDIKTHQKVFINYLEVIIRSDGTVEYATPSHSERLIRLASEKYKTDRDGVSNMCPPEFYFDYQDWLLLITDCVAVWNGFTKGRLNLPQALALLSLQDAGLYKGYIASTIIRRDLTSLINK